MAIVEDASSPVAVSASANTTAATTTASFTPPANCIVVATVAYDWNANYTGAAVTPTFSDNRSGVWHVVSSANAGSGGSSQTAVAYTVITTSQSMTVTATAGDAKSKSKLLVVKVLTGTAITGTIAGSIFSGNSTTTGVQQAQQTVTTTTAGSKVIMTFAKDANKTIAVNANTTEFSHLNDSTVGAVVMSGKATSLTGTPGSVSLGWTFTSTTGATSCSGDIAEIMPAPSGPTPVSDDDAGSMTESSAIANSANVSNDFESGSNGTTLTTGNTASPNAFDVIDHGTGATTAFDSAHSAHGSLGLKIQNGTGAAGVQWTTSVGTSGTIFGRFYLFTPALPTSNTRIMQAATASNLCAAIYLNTSGTLTFVNTSVGTIFSTTASVNVGGWSRVEYKIIGDPAVGQVELKLFNTMDSSTPDEVKTSAATQNTFGPMSVYALGMAFDSHASFGPFYFDDIGLSTDAYLGSALTITPIASTDTSSASESTSIAIGVALSGTNTGLASESTSIAIGVALNGTNTSTQAESTAIKVTTTDDDTGTQAEASSIAVPVAGTDTSSLADGESVAVGISSSDTSAQGETGTNAVRLATSDTGNLAENQALNVSLAASNATAGTESQAIAVSLTGADTGSALDGSAVSLPVAGADTGSMAETQAISTPATSADTGSQTEHTSIAVAQTGTDVASSTEAGNVSVRLAASDSSAMAESATLAIRITATDTGSLRDRGRVNTLADPFVDQDFSATADGLVLAGTVVPSVLSAEVQVIGYSSTGNAVDTELDAVVTQTTVDATPVLVSVDAAISQVQYSGTARNVGR